MGFKVSKFGEWTRAGNVLQALQTKLYPLCEAQLRENGELILNRMREHIIEQDLNWTPLSPTTIRLKNGYDEIYIDSGFLYDNLEVRKVKSSAHNVTMFVGASPWKRHPESGEKLSDLMIWLEYGTHNMPPRPLVRETWDELEPLIKASWRDKLGELVTKAGR